MVFGTILKAQCGKFHTLRVCLGNALDQRQCQYRTERVTCSILLKDLPTHTHQRDIKRVLDVVLGTGVCVVLLSCVVETCNRLRHVEYPSKLPIAEHLRAHLRRDAAPSGHFQRHLVSVLHFKEGQGQFYKLRVAAYREHDLSRRYFDMGVVPRHEVLNEQIVVNVGLTQRLFRTSRDPAEPRSRCVPSRTWTLCPTC